MINIFIGYDPNEISAYQNLCYSIMRNSSEPVAITPLKMGNLQKVYTRPRHELASTEFSISRFMVPYLMNYEGHAIFMDCDMLVLDDIANLWALRDDKYAVQVCKHDYTPNSDRKFLDQVQTKYQKKNWSSVMLFNNKRCDELTQEYVHEASGLELHQFKWLEGDHMIGELPLEWNWLAGEYEEKYPVSNIHWTLGGPYLKATKNCDYAKEWFDYYIESDTINY